MSDELEPRTQSERVSPEHALRREGIIFLSSHEEGELDWVQFFSADQIVTTEDGRKIKASTLPSDRTTVTFGHILETAFGLLRAEATSEYRKCYKEVITILAQYNRLSLPSEQISISIVDTGRANHYLFSLVQTDRLVSLLLENRERLEPHFPFGISEEEIKEIQAGKSEIEERIKARLRKLGETSLRAQKIPMEDRVRIISQVVAHPSTWTILISKGRSDSKKFFLTFLYWRVVNYRRDTKNRLKREKEEQTPLRFLIGSPLRQFFLSNLPGSPLAERMLVTLTQFQREIFYARYLESKSLKQISKALEKDRESLAYSARRFLESFVSMSIEQWPKAHFQQIIWEIISNHPDFYEAFLTASPFSWRKYAQLKYGEKLTDKEIAEKMGLPSVLSAKSLGHRFREKLIRKTELERELKAPFI